MKLLKFYFGTKVGLQSPSQTLRKLSDILCWILNISGVILSCFCAWSHFREFDVHIIQM